MSTHIHLVTGASSGMGLEIARRLAQHEGAQLIAGVRNPEGAQALREAVPAKQLIILPLDLERHESIRAFVSQLEAKLPPEACLDSIICNAGVQPTGPKVLISPEVERGFQINFLGHVELIDLLLSRLSRGGTVVMIGSATHNPDNRLAARFGFRGASFPSAREVALGDIGREGSERHQNMDRYATAKLCAIYYALHFGRQVPQEEACFYAFDPGLMAGTGLARDRSLPERLGWHLVLPLLQRFLRGTSTPKESAEALVQHLVLNPQHVSGSYVDFNGELAPRSELSRDAGNASALVEVARRLIETRQTS